MKNPPHIGGFFFNTKIAKVNNFAYPQLNGKGIAKIRLNIYTSDCGDVHFVWRFNRYYLKHE